MRKYDRFEVDRDIFKGRKHIYYLMGVEEGTNSCYVIASYSIKTGRIILKDVENHIPSGEVLRDFVRIEKGRYGAEK